MKWRLLPVVVGGLTVNDVNNVVGSPWCTKKCKIEINEMKKRHKVGETETDRDRERKYEREREKSKIYLETKKCATPT